jgi:hypothetical protein
VRAEGGAAGRDRGTASPGEGGQPARSEPADLPTISRDEEAIGWGDEWGESAEDSDVARLLADRPPHHDRA